MNNCKQLGIAAALFCICGVGNAETVEGTCWSVSFNYPYGVAVDRSGNIFVLDSNDGTVHRITQTGAAETFAGISGNKGYADGSSQKALFSKPTDVATDRNGNVYIADSGNRVIRKISPEGMVTTLAGTAGVSGHADGVGAAASFKSPRGIAVDASGYVYVADAYSNTIRKISPAGVVTTLAGIAGMEGHADGLGAAARFRFPTDVAIDKAGNIYVSDSLNNTIRKITQAGLVTTIAGAAGLWGSTDAAGADARFNHPNGIATDSSGNIFVAETNNGRIRKITPDGVVTTLAASFIRPDNVSTDNAGNLYVTDTANEAVCKFPLMEMPYIGEKHSASKQGTAHSGQTSVRLLVYGTHEGDNIVYHYKVVNNGGVSLNNFVIGSTVIGNTVEGMVGEEVPQLERLPAGWKYGREGETGTEILLSPTSTSQPTNWESDFYSQEGASGNYYLQWKTTPANTYGIPPGQSLAGFSIRVPLYDSNETPREYWNAAQVVDGEQDDIYLTGNFKVSYWDPTKNELKNVWGPIEISDSTPPTLSISLSPNVLRKNNKYVPVTATITVKDDLDPQPDIKLLSITANEPIDADDIKVGQLFTDIRQFELKADHDGKSHAGRIYTVTYFAADGSGNQTEATATVTVPHDWRKHEERRDKDEKKDKDRKERSR